MSLLIAKVHAATDSRHSYLIPAATMGSGLIQFGSKVF